MRVAALSLCLLAGCGALRATKPERLSGGDYRSRCNEPLHACLASFESVCGDGYDVVRAVETHERKGSYPGVYEIFSSEAVVRCRIPQPLIGGARERGDAGLAPPAEVPVATTPQPSKAAAPDQPRGCFPGTTQACLGPGACAGAQVCAADGTSFGACDCGSGRARDGGEGS